MGRTRNWSCRMACIGVEKLPRAVVRLAAELHAIESPHDTVVCILNRPSRRTLQVLNCSYPGATVVSLASNQEERATIKKWFAGRLRFRPLNDTLYGLFDGSAQPPTGLSCDVLAIDADRSTAEERQGVVVGLSQALKLRRRLRTVVLMSGTQCAGGIAEEYLVGGVCFRFRVPPAGRHACKRRDCLVREQCTQRATCWQSRWAELVNAAWLTNSTCVSSRPSYSSQGKAVLCVASISSEPTICTRGGAPLLNGVAPKPLKWSAPPHWRRRSPRPGPSADANATAQIALLRSWRYISFVPCGNELCLVFKDDVTETWVGSLRSADGVHFRGAPELVLPSMWAPGKATHNLAILFLNGSYYFAGGRDRGCRIFARNQPGCRPADPRERGIWMSRSTAGIHYHLDGDGKAVQLAVSTTSGRAKLPAGLKAESSTWVNPRMVLSGRQPGCHERREPELLPWITRGVCEYDGRLSLAYFAGRFWLYARANLGKHGQRFVQVTSSEDGISWAPFQLLQLNGYRPSRGDVYFFAAQANPIHSGSLLALFPVVHHGSGCICLAFSTDGFRWSEPRPLIHCQTVGERTTSHPAAGLVRRGMYVYIWIHENVPGVNIDATMPWPHQLAAQRSNSLATESRVVRYRVRTDTLLLWTMEAVASFERPQ